MKPSPVLILLAAGLGGCVAGLGEAPPSAPEAPLPEVRSLAPSPGMVWVAGSWHLDGQRWVWIPGRWEMAPPVPGGYRATLP